MENNIFSIESKLDFLDEYQWNAKKRNILEENIREPDEKKRFNIEGHPIAEIFIRELAQNALDAEPEKKGKKVILNLDLLEYKSEYEKSLYRKFINQTILKWLKKSEDIDEKFKLNYKALRASDFNTLV